MKLRLASGKVAVILELMDTPTAKAVYALACPTAARRISADARPKLVNPCNVLGKVIGDPGMLSKIKAGGL